MKKLNIVLLLCMVAVMKASDDKRFPEFNHPGWDRAHTLAIHDGKDGRGHSVFGDLEDSGSDDDFGRLEGSCANVQGASATSAIARRGSMRVELPSDQRSGNAAKSRPKTPSFAGPVVVSESDDELADVRSYNSVVTSSTSNGNVLRPGTAYPSDRNLLQRQKEISSVVYPSNLTDLFEEKSDVSSVSRGALQGNGTPVDPSFERYPANSGRTGDNVRDTNPLTIESSVGVGAGNNERQAVSLLPFAPMEVSGSGQIESTALSGHSVPAVVVTAQADHRRALQGNGTPVDPSFAHYLFPYSDGCASSDKTDASNARNLRDTNPLTVGEEGSNRLPEYPVAAVVVATQAVRVHNSNPQKTIGQKIVGFFAGCCSCSCCK